MTSPDIDALPPGSLLLHPGMPKTGTTALQNSLSVRRDVLAEHGTLYPGSAVNHRAAVYAFAGMHDGWRGEDSGDVPSIRHWRRLVSEVRASRAERVLVSHEMISSTPVETRRRMLDELGRDPHVVITMRSLAATLTSTYQQRLKVGAEKGFEAWLRSVMRRDPADPHAKRSTMLLNHGRIVSEWADLVGAENVTVVVLDPADRSLVPATFERLLDLPPTTLASVQLSGRQLNRSLTLPEASLVRELNRALRARPGLDWRQYERLMVHGTVRAILEDRAPGASEKRIVPPRWAVERAQQIASRSNDAIRAAGVRVVGDLANLESAVESTESPRGRSASVPLAVASVAALGAMDPVVPGAAPGWRGRTRSAVHRVEGIRTGELFLALAGRAARMLAGLVRR